MAQYNIDKDKIRGVVIEVSRALDGKGFNAGEMMVGLSEMLGRIIVETASSHVQMKEMVDICAGHLDRTIIAGNEAKGKSLIARV